MPGLTFCPTSHEVISSCVHRGAIRHQRPPPIIWAKLSDRHYRDPKPRFVNTRYFFQWRPYGCLHFIVLRLPVYFFSWKCKLSLVHALLLLLEKPRAVLPRHRVPHRRGHTRGYVRTTINIRIISGSSSSSSSSSTTTIIITDGV